MRYKVHFEFTAHASHPNVYISTETELGDEIILEVLEEPVPKCSNPRRVAKDWMVGPLTQAMLDRLSRE